MDQTWKLVGRHGQTLPPAIPKLTSKAILKPTLTTIPTGLWSRAVQGRKFIPHVVSGPLFTTTTKPTSTTFRWPINPTDQLGWAASKAIRAVQHEQDKATRISERVVQQLIRQDLFDGYHMQCKSTNEYLLFRQGSTLPAYLAYYQTETDNIKIVPIPFNEDDFVVLDNVEPKPNQQTTNNKKKVNPTFFSRRTPANKRQVKHNLHTLRHPTPTNMKSVVSGKYQRLYNIRLTSYGCRRHLFARRAHSDREAIKRRREKARLMRKLICKRIRYLQKIEERLNTVFEPVMEDEEFSEELTCPECKLIQCTCVLHNKTEQLTSICPTCKLPECNCNIPGGVNTRSRASVRAVPLFPGATGAANAAGATGAVNAAGATGAAGAAGATGGTGAGTGGAGGGANQVDMANFTAAVQVLGDTLKSTLAPSSKAKLKIKKLTSKPTTVQLLRYLANIEQLTGLSDADRIQIAVHYIEDETLSNRATDLYQTNRFLSWFDFRTKVILKHIGRYAKLE